MAFGKTPPTLQQIDARLRALRVKLAAITKAEASASTKAKPAWRKKRQRIQAAIRTLLSLRTRVTKAKASRSSKPVVATSTEDATIDEGTKQGEGMEAASEEGDHTQGQGMEASNDTGYLGKPDPLTISKRISDARLQMTAYRNNITAVDAQLRVELTKKTMFWTSRVAALKKRRAELQTKLGEATTILSRLLAQQRAIAPSAHSAATLTRVAAQYKKVERPAATYVPTAASVVQKKQGEGMTRVAAAAAPIQQALTEQRARFERARIQRNYAQSTRINAIIEQLETQLRAVQMQAPAYAPSPYSATTPVQYTAMKQGSDARVEPVSNLPGAADASTTQEPTIEDMESQEAAETSAGSSGETPWYKRPLFIVGAIAAAAVAVVLAKGKKGKKEHAQVVHVPSSH